MFRWLSIYRVLPPSRHLPCSGALVDLPDGWEVCPPDAEGLKVGWHCCCCCCCCCCFLSSADIVCRCAGTTLGKRVFLYLRTDPATGLAGIVTLSHVTRHPSHVTCHTSHVTRYCSHMNPWSNLSSPGKQVKMFLLTVAVTFAAAASAAADEDANETVFELTRPQF